MAVVAVPRRRFMLVAGAAGLGVMAEPTIGRLHSLLTRFLPAQTPLLLRDLGDFALSLAAGVTANLVTQPLLRILHSGSAPTSVLDAVQALEAKGSSPVSASQLYSMERDRYLFGSLAANQVDGYAAFLSGSGMIAVPAPALVGINRAAATSAGRGGLTGSDLYNAFFPVAVTWPYQGDGRWESTNEMAWETTRGGILVQWYPAGDGRSVTMRTVRHWNFPPTTVTDPWQPVNYV